MLVGNQSCTVSYSIPLHYGANLVSYPFPFSNTLSSALPEEATANLDGIVGEGVSAALLPDGTWVGSLTEFEGTKGYWFISNEDVSSFSFNLNDGGFARHQGFASNNNLLGYEFNQSAAQCFYYIKDIDIVEDGDWIIAYNNDVVVGGAQWKGYMTDVPVMGNDFGGAYSEDYMQNGEIPTFQIYDHNSGMILDAEPSEEYGWSMWGNNMVDFQAEWVACRAGMITPRIIAMIINEACANQ